MLIYRQVTYKGTYYAVIFLYCLRSSWKSRNTWGIKISKNFCRDSCFITPSSPTISSVCLPWVLKACRGVSIGRDLEESLLRGRRLIQKRVRRRWKIWKEVFVVGYPINLLRNRLLIRRLRLDRKQLNRFCGINLFGEAFLGRPPHRVGAQASFEVRLWVVSQLTGFHNWLKNVNY